MPRDLIRNRQTRVVSTKVETGLAKVGSEAPPLKPMSPLSAKTLRVRTPLDGITGAELVENQCRSIAHRCLLVRAVESGQSENIPLPRT